MFTGLIKTIGEIRHVDQRGDRLFTIAMDEVFPVEMGDSVACHGICLTATTINGHAFKVSASEETLRSTNAGEWKVGTRINLEPALRLGDRLGGHMVSGHVDGVARTISQTPEGDSVKWVFEVPPAFAKFIAPKGSVTLDGVSLTVNEVVHSIVEVSARSPEGEPHAAGVCAAKGTRSPSTIFSVNIIPHTQKATCFAQLRVGDSVNFEVDLLARYVARLTEAAA